ncbi:polysaccharide biosynthesis protein [Paenibacillus sp. HB172176]|uniref:putative polysaccharide biosynthesis protein n=1 Tax=Paenibacillus sp. HB172176 TaxID=2493690 RepID=UPI001438DC69|nr:polysaccharide biosynthesis protein [Paenibacillus sp. HB172176]
MLKKDSLLKGTIILAAAALFARFLGLFQRIPLDYMLGEEGFNSFNLANSIYLLLLLLATAGFPSAISKMVSQRYALGKYEEAKRIYKAALFFGAVSGFIMAAGLFFFAGYFSDVISNQPNADLSVRAISPALLFFPIIAMMRGYFQGRQMMSAGGLSQIVEQFLRVFLGIGLGLIVLSLGWSDRWGAAAITFGSVFGSLGALSVMLFYVRKLRNQDRQLELEKRQLEAVQEDYGYDEGPNLRFRTIYREIFRMSVPAIVTSSVINVIFTFDLSLFDRLSGSFYTVSEAILLKKDLGIAQSLAGIPPILAIALGSSIIPVISSAFSLNNMNEVKRQASIVLRVVCFTGVPFALLLTVASYSITGLLFKSTHGYEVVAALAASTIVQITMMTTNSILYGLGKQRISMRNTLIGLVLKIVFSLALTPILGVYGLIIASVVCFTGVTAFNVRSINKIAKLTILGKRWIPYLLAVIISGIAGWGAEQGMLHSTNAWIVKLSFLTSAAVAGLALGLFYMALLILLKVVTPEDTKSLPSVLRKPMSKIMKLKYRRREFN